MLNTIVNKHFVGCLVDKLNGLVRLQLSTSILLNVFCKAFKINLQCSLFTVTACQRTLDYVYGSCGISSSTVHIMRVVLITPTNIVRDL